ncbi:MAG: hypothetical protein R3C59_00370 [Planctomycetaceae bacterium]
MNLPRLRAASLQFEILPESDSESDSRTHARIVDVAGPLKTTLLLLQDGEQRVCLVTTHFGWTTPTNVCDVFRQAVATELNLPTSHVLLFSSHNHCCVAFAANAVQAYASYGQDVPPAELLPVGGQFLNACRECARQLPERLEPVQVWWAEGREGRITYNRKGRHADGSGYLMREQDRLLLGRDFNGDIDQQAPIVTFRNASGNTVAALTQFTGHPVTAYHPERPVVFGEWPQVACDAVSAYLANGLEVPVGFLQGCAGDVNSKEMLCGTVARSTQFGAMLGESYIRALSELQPSVRDGMDFSNETVNLPLAPLPLRDMLAAELNEMDDFIRRANAGDPNTLFCVGQNFPESLSPPFRIGLVEMIRRWTVWALEQHDSGMADSVATELGIDVAVIRVGDVGLVGMSCEPFQEIGRRIRRGSPLPLSIPCGYTNVSHGYITDSGNTGDQEYMSAHYRYTKFRPPLQKPAGDVLADHAVRLLKRFAKDSPS